jgi:nicotinate-nucleotide pyrophosphorylase (carboxylating)
MPRDPGQTERLIRRLRWDELDRAWLLRFAEFAREEDLAGLGLAERPLRVGDPSAALLAGAERARARVVARRPMVLAGLGLLDVVFAAYGGRCHAKPLAYDGQYVPAGTAVAEVEGPAAELLSAERILLNFLQRLCGVATYTREHVLALGSSPTKLLDTRKTTPGFRMLEKYAVGQGGGHNHRLGLFDRIMVKDNHLAAGGATAGERITKMVRRARESRSDLLVEVEVGAGGAAVHDQVAVLVAHRVAVLVAHR